MGDVAKGRKVAIEKAIKNTIETNLKSKEVG